MERIPTYFAACKSCDFVGPVRAQIRTVEEVDIQSHTFDHDCRVYEGIPDMEYPR